MIIKCLMKKSLKYTLISMIDLIEYELIHKEYCAIGLDMSHQHYFVLIYQSGKVSIIDSYWSDTIETGINMHEFYIDDLYELINCNNNEHNILLWNTIFNADKTVKSYTWVEQYIYIN